jgi:hypothetical protein
MLPEISAARERDSQADAFHAAYELVRSVAARAKSSNHDPIEPEPQSTPEGKH